MPSSQFYFRVFIAFENLLHLIFAQKQAILG